jgi:archaellum biogenesis protein FlaJ (TadC family)
MLDSYSVHRTDEDKEYARSLGIILLCVPPGMTDALQPLDRSVFGAVKQEARRLWRLYVSSLSLEDRVKVSRAKAT